MAKERGDFYQGFTAILDEDILPDQLVPTPGRLLTRSRVHDAEEKTKGGIYIPRHLQGEKQTTTGEVLRIGEDVEDGYVVGDTLVYGKYSGVSLKFLADHDEHPEVRDYVYRLLYPEDILCKIG